ncbi:hypothetical protein BJV77DRAFT_1003788 [Russula vinacea]|nr:hypothetical protein BJV77DRAFT_1003788 [Russula vinacea]
MSTTIPIPPFSPTDISDSLSATTSMGGATVTSPGSVTTVSSMNLAGPSTEGYPATEVIKYLVDAVGHDVMSFRRNAQVSYILVDRAREVCEAINEYIRFTENGADWTSFEKFTNAIDPIEEALFALIAHTADEKTRHLTSGNSVEDCVISTERWGANREHIWSALDTLETKQELADLFSGLDTASREADRIEAQLHDDKTFLRRLLRTSKTPSRHIRSMPVPINAGVVFDLTFSRLPVTIRSVCKNLDESLDRLAKGSSLAAVTPYTVKTALVVQGIVNLSLRNAPIDNATRNHLRSRAVWEAAEELTDLLNSTQSDDKNSINEIRLAYDGFLRLVRNTTELPPPKSYLELMKQAGRVRRPFQAQALAIITLCRTLVTEFEKESHHTAHNVLPLEDACDEALKALTQVVAAVTELKIFDLARLEEHPASKALRDVKEPIKTCFNSFGLGDSWAEKEQLFSDAVAKDRKRMEDLNRLLTKRPPLTLQEKAALVKVTVDIYYPDETQGNVMVPIGKAARKSRCFLPFAPFDSMC